MHTQASPVSISVIEDGQAPQGWMYPDFGVKAHLEALIVPRLKVRRFELWEEVSISSLGGTCRQEVGDRTPSIAIRTKRAGAKVQMDLP